MKSGNDMRSDLSKKEKAEIVEKLCISVFTEIYKFLQLEIDPEKKTHLSKLLEHLKKTKSYLYTIPALKSLACNYNYYQALQDIGGEDLSLRISSRMKDIIVEEAWWTMMCKFDYLRRLYGYAPESEGGFKDQPEFRKVLYSPDYERLTQL